jgi:hypothetical protein
VAFSFPERQQWAHSGRCVSAIEWQLLFFEGIWWVKYLKTSLSGRDPVITFLYPQNKETGKP